MQLLLVGIVAGLLGGPATGVPYDDAAWPEFVSWPSYSDSLSSMEARPVVLVRVSVDAKGMVTDASIIRSFVSVALDSAALAAARKWRFVPAIKDDVPVESHYNIPFYFRANDQQRQGDSVRVWEPLPAETTNEAADALETLVGAELFAEHFRLNARRSGCRILYRRRQICTAFFRFHDPGRPWADMDVLVPLESSDSLAATGIRFPNCREDPAECSFIVSQQMAVDIARGAELADGLKPWKIRLFWHDIMGDMVWSVENTLHPAPNLSGELVHIDASSGDVLEKMGWAIH